MARPKKTTKPSKATSVAASVPEMSYVAPRAMANPVMAANPYSFQSFVSWINNNFAIILFVGVFFIAGFTAGSLWTQNQMLKKGIGAAAPAAQVADAAAEPEGPTQEQLKAIPEVTGDDHVLGNNNAQITLIEYSDFECPFCARFHPTMQQIMKDYGDDVRWVYRHYPLSFHPNAQKAAEASECAVKLGGKDMFWKFGDRLIEENNTLGGRLTADTIYEVAKELGLNETSFKTCVDSGEFADKVAEQMAAASASGISGTPGTVVVTKDGEYDFIAGAYPLEDVKATIDQYLK